MCNARETGVSNVSVLVSLGLMGLRFHQLFAPLGSNTTNIEIFLMKCLVDSKIIFIFGVFFELLCEKSWSCHPPIPY